MRNARCRVVESNHAVFELVRASKILLSEERTNSGCFFLVWEVEPTFLTLRICSYPSERIWMLCDRLSGDCATTAPQAPFWWTRLDSNQRIAC